MAVVTAMLSVLLCLLYLRERGINRRINRELMYVKERIGRLTVEEGDGYVLLPSANRGIRELTAQINRLLEDLYLQKEDDRRARLAMMQVLTNISHDLRTPLTVLKGYSELLAGRMRKRDLGEAEKMAAKIGEKTDELVSVIGKYFTISKLESGDMRMAQRRIDLTRLCHEVMLDYYDLLETAQFAVEIQMDGRPVYVHGDEEAIVRILKNLIENAMKHGGDGRFLGIRLRCLSEKTVIEVEDHGKGISVRDQERIFDRNFTTARKGSGSGLGLAIAWELAGRMSAKLEVDSEPGVRTVFRVLFASEAAKDAGREELLEKS